MALALYRRYRPETFEEVIGQDHVVQPLQQALRNQRVNHAYLFSGPRGCGKTTSARLLARCLNCEQGPAPTPCGVCKSCRDLARGGPGSIDVIEIDAASHGGVDDARDLRERAFFAPVSARFKIYILDEAHMVSPAGFNALLKVVEEPPPHLKFIFATTEPEKVIGTIRSRTHHYPFRLVPPATLRDYLAVLCESEKIAVDPNALPLVVRAGAGSVRDSLSILDQLLAGAGPDGVSYQMAVSLLGFTDAALLDEAVSAFAARDGAAAFQAVDHVVEGGHDPRRFLADLLERLRDLVILAAVPDAAQKGLINAPGDQLARMAEQAAAFGSADLSRAADLVNSGLLEMRGATAPRLLLELICARVLLPGADDTVRGVAARLDRLERGGGGGNGGGGYAGSGVSGVLPPSVGGSDPTAGGHAATGQLSQPGQLSQAAQASQAGQPNQSSQAPAGQASAASGLGAPPWKGAGAAQAAPDPAVVPEPAHSAPAQSSVRAGQAPAGSGTSVPAQGGDASGSVRQQWPQVVDAVARRSKAVWVMISQNVHVVGVDGRVLQLGFSSSGIRDSFVGSQREEVLREALREITGTDWKLDTMVDPSAGIAPAAPPRALPSQPPPSGDPAASSGWNSAAAGLGAMPRQGGEAQSGAPAEQAAPPPGFATPPSASATTGSAGPPSSAPAADTASSNGGGTGAAASGTGQSGARPAPPTAPATAPSAAASSFGAASAGGSKPDFPPPPGPDEEEEPDGDDESADAGPTARDLLVRELGATVVDEISSEF